MASVQSRCAVALLMIALCGTAVHAADKQAKQSAPSPAPASKPAAVVTDQRPAIEAGLRLAADLKAMGVDVTSAQRQLQQMKTSGAPREAVDAVVRELALKNPLLNFEKLLVVRRRGHEGLPANWQGNCSLPRDKSNDELVSLSLRDGATATLFKPAKPRFVGDVDLNFDGKRLLLSTLDDRNRYQIFEMNIDGSGMRQLTKGEEPDVDNYDPVYLPDGRIIYNSTVTYQGVPCVRGSDHVGNLMLLDEKAGTVRRLTFDQEHDWYPTVMNDGSVMYLRWEYTDLPHSNSRIMFQMNPDGTHQRELYGSGSYFPNSLFAARPIPGTSQFVGVISGHHGTRRSGRLLIFDPDRSRMEASGVVQEIPGYGKKVEAVVRDRLVDGVWPQFMHPYPLSDKYFIVAMKPSAKEPWGIYLADVWDNLVLLKAEPGVSLFEPLPLRATQKPPVVVDRVNLKEEHARVYISDIYDGPGLDGVPRGTVKKLRLFEYHYSFRGVGGLLGAVGADGPWDIRRVLGTVDVKPDGSAAFMIPANTPVSVQPLNEDDEALQVMRSWFVGMPGETVTCVGCHASQQKTASMTTARAYGDVVPLKAWAGAHRGFSFPRDVQPVLDKYCVSCHDGKPGPDGKPVAYLKGDKLLEDFKLKQSGNIGQTRLPFSVAYDELARLVRRPGIESDMALLSPADFTASTTELVQMLRKGHHGVTMDDEAWERIVMWIDLNAPYHGTWSDMFDPAHVQKMAQRQRELRMKYAPQGLGPNMEEPGPMDTKPIDPVTPETEPALAAVPQVAGWPFGADEAAKMQAQAAGGKPAVREIDLGNGVKMRLRLIPAGEFVMGESASNIPLPGDERHRMVVKVDKPFWMAECEVSNAQFARFDPQHDSRLESRHGYQFGRLGWPLNEPNQPAVRLSAKEAQAFCDWLSSKVGAKVSLPSEAQWEWAARAGSDQPFWFGDLSGDFSRFANLGDRRLKEYAADTSYEHYAAAGPLKDPNRYDDWVPKDDRFDDGSFLSAAVGKYEANPWGLRDMHGNVWEWTRTQYQAQPNAAVVTQTGPVVGDGKVSVRGGSFYDRPIRCRSASRLFYPSWQRVFNVGFRVVVEP